MSRRTRKRTAYLETSAGGVVYRWVGDEPKVLLIRDAYTNWGLPKGHIEEGESPADAALREVREETGLEQLALGPRLETIDWYFNGSKGLIHKYCHFYLIESSSGEAEPQVEEGITECRWLPFAGALEQISYSNAREVLLIAARSLGWELEGIG